MERMEAQRIADGFESDAEPVFTHEYVHEAGPGLPYPIRFLGTTDSRAVQGRNTLVNLSSLHLEICRRIGGRRA